MINYTSHQKTLALLLFLGASTFIFPPSTNAVWHIVLNERFQGSSLTWPWGNWTINPNRPPTGSGPPYSWGVQYVYYKPNGLDTHSLWCCGQPNSLDPFQDNYPPGTVSWAKWGPINLSQAVAAQANFWYYCNTEPVQDYFRWGAYPSNTFNMYESDRRSGISTNWVNGFLDFDSLAGGTQSMLGQGSVYIVFQFVADGDNQVNVGAFLDEVNIAWDDGMLDLEAKSPFFQDMDSVTVLQPLIGDSVYFVLTWTAAGSGMTPPFDINCYLDGNLFSTERRTVNIGTSMVVWEISYSTPWVVDANTHTVSWLLDANHEITEAIETNNDTSLTFTGILPNDPPWIQLTSPVEGDSATNEFLITWEDRDDNDNAEIYLYWDNDTLEYNGNSIPNAYAIPEDDTTDAFLWDVSAMPEGPVWVLAFITDGLLSMWDYSDGPLYIYHPPIPSLEVNTYAINPPIVVPLNGGWFYYNINVHNFGTQAQTFNVWNRLRMPNGAISYPVWGPLTRTLPANANPTRSLQQTIAGNYPGGSYLYISYIGTFPWIVSDSSYFEFFKSSIPEGNRWVEETTCTGDFFDAYASQDNPDVGAQHAAPLPENLAVLGVSPNPFNPTTAIRFDLPQAARVTLEVFDINGRVVGVQHVEPLQAGSHQIQFDGSELPSGIYLYRLTASGSGATPTIATGKMVLLK